VVDLALESFLARQRWHLRISTNAHCGQDAVEAAIPKGKKVLIVGGGASAIEALEFAVKNGAAEIDVLSRSDK
jgi:cation diffusion facilitator CzcD-associated flavoprotein CzcO